MSALASDDFNRADFPNPGANWTTLATYGPLEIVSNEAVGRSAGAFGDRYSGALSGGVAWPDNQYSEVMLGATIETVSDNGAGALVRASSTVTEGWYLSQTNTVETRVYKDVAGAYTQMGSDGATGTTGDLMRLIASGTTISLTKNGTTIVGPVTDAGIASGQAGMFSARSLTNCTINSWEGGSLAAITVQPTDQSVAFGATASLSITATGATTYQWQDDRNGLFANCPDGSGATTASYTTAATDVVNRRFRCLVDSTLYSSAANRAGLMGVAWVYR